MDGQHVFVNFLFSTLCKLDTLIWLIITWKLRFIENWQSEMANTSKNEPFQNLSSQLISQPELISLPVIFDVFQKSRSTLRKLLERGSAGCWWCYTAANYYFCFNLHVSQYSKQLWVTYCLVRCQNAEKSLEPKLTIGKICLNYSPIPFFQKPRDKTHQTNGEEIQKN